VVGCWFSGLSNWDFEQIFGIFGLAMVLATFQNIMWFFSNHLVTLFIDEMVNKMSSWGIGKLMKRLGAIILASGLKASKMLQSKENKTKQKQKQKV
jgi:hypothetical protein